MPTVRDLRDRIRSLKNTQQITKAMKQVAAAKIRRAEQLQKQSRPYADAIGEMLRDLIAAVGNVDHPFMQPGKEGAPSGIILLTADKGLAGAFNANLIRQAELRRRQNANLRFYTVGVKGRNSVRRLLGTANDESTWALSHGSKFDVAREVAARVSDDFVNGRISEIVMISPKLISMMSQRPEIRRIIPVSAGGNDPMSQPGRNANAANANRNDSGDRPADAQPPKRNVGSVEFEPSAEAVLSRLLPKYLEFTIYSAMLETDAAFFAAQLVAMNNATDNAKKLIDTLTIEMNNARQAAITKEILEIVGGAEALAG